MGSTTSRFSEKELAEYQELTFLSRSEILCCYEMFYNLDPERVEKDANVRHSLSTMMNLEEIQVNPFRDRICKVFSSKNDGSMSFEDFLDMMSTFNESAPRRVKIEYAFRIYDFNTDDYICRDDMKKIIRRISGRQRYTNIELKEIVDKIPNGRDARRDERQGGSIPKGIMEEADLDEDDRLSFAEFEHIIFKDPDFMRTFRIRI